LKGVENGTKFLVNDKVAEGKKGLSFAPTPPKAAFLYIARSYSGTPYLGEDGLIFSIDKTIFLLYP